MSKGSYLHMTITLDLGETSCSSVAATSIACGTSLVVYISKFLFTCYICIMFYSYMWWKRRGTRGLLVQNFYGGSYLFFLDIKHYLDSLCFL